MRMRSRRPAPAGIPPNIAMDVSPDRLRRFFVPEESGYGITRTIRDMVIFATQDLIKGPPFTKLDLVSCRNVLIYLEPELQSRLIPVFHYALKPGGVLFLSPSESIGSSDRSVRPPDRAEVGPALSGEGSLASGSSGKKRWPRSARGLQK